MDASRRPDGGTAALESRAVRIDVTFDLLDVSGGNKVLVSRTGSVDITVPYFDASVPLRAFVPIQLEGGLAACIAIDTFYKGDVDNLGMAITNRWELRGASSSGFARQNFGVGLDGEPSYGTTTSLSWDGKEFRARLVVAAKPGTSGAPAVTLVPGESPDPCAASLQPRVISSVKDI